MRPAVRFALAFAMGAGVLMASATSGAQSPSGSAPVFASSPSSPAPFVAGGPAAFGPSRPRPSNLKSLARQALQAPPVDQRPSADQRLSPGESVPPEQLQAFVDGVVRQAMSRDHIAGVTVAVVQNGQVVMKKGYGFAGPGRAVDPDQTLFRLGSISKTFTWIALMKEAEAGRIRLTAPVNLYLPEKLKVGDEGFKRDLLVRDLMTHSPGFEDRMLGQLFEENPARVRPLFEYLRQERPRRVREAGALPVYSNYGAALAGEAVSYVNGHPFQDLVETEITRPLGLDHTTFREPYPARSDLPAPLKTSLAADLSTGYRWAQGGYKAEPTEYLTHVAPAGAVSSTAGDMARYMLMILGGGQLDGTTIYNADTARGFRTTLQTSAPGVNGWDDGFMEFALPGGYRGQGHGGDTLWFHAGMVTVPALNLGVFVGTNTDTGPGLAHALPEQIVGRFYAPPQAEPRAGSPSLAQDRETYAGTYVDDRRPYGGLGKFALMLISQLKVSVTPDGRLLTTGGGRTQAWTPDGDSGRFLAVDGPQVSAFDVKDGRAQRWYAPSGATAFDRVGPLLQTPTLIVLAALTLLASIAVMVGQFTRDPREFRQTTSQSRANLVQATIAVLWIFSLVTFAAWGVGAQDQPHVILHWPGPFLLVASACALVAALLTLLTLVMSPWLWRGGRRLDSWSAGRKLGFTATTLIFTAFSVVLGLWGALEPWSR
ncbi:MAG TPA: serine hydrolase [Caulobacteraceae bacterium]|jgi:CubicO group peptidase (beta-lactamase class C family)